ncbi:MAG: hypothetical protein HQK96_09075 [Nitrospirae bacterium]|nr:hypothetical protein [Nitrospirota bacterium]
MCRDEQYGEDLDEGPDDKEPFPPKDKDINDIKYLLLTGKGKKKDIRRIILCGSIL